MNRRAFLASIPLLPAAAKAVIQRPLGLREIFDAAIEGDYKCANHKIYELRSSTWTTTFPRPERHLILSPMTEREYRQHRLARQLAMPAPNLP